VFEDLELKQKILREVEASGADDVILATTTSAIPIGRIAEACAHPERVVGMHYFSPVHRVPLVEIVAGRHTAPEVVATCAALARRQGKKVIVVNDGIGFYTTRILAAYVMAGFDLLGDGEPIDHIDGSLEAWGFPMGPIRVADEIGMELVLEIASSIRELGDRFALPTVVRNLQQAGFAGRAARRLYVRRDEDTSPHPDVYARLDMEPRRSLDPEDLAWKCAGRMIDEAIRCLDQGILRSPDDGDAGAVFGLGFPAFRGGPFRVLDQIGPVELRNKLQRLGVACGQELIQRAEQREHPDRTPRRLVAHG
jgi:3-hydroxyacyl-CoA dehydrogenase / enoyl-CoA hydratase / 3-hydroxybutyryl-CoA epimerase